MISKRNDSELNRGLKCWKVRFFELKKCRRKRGPKGHVTCLCDVSLLDSKQNMVESKRKPVKKGGHTQPRSQGLLGFNMAAGLEKTLAHSELKRSLIGAFLT